MSSAKLQEMVKTEGLVYKKGKFSAIEENALKNAIQQYRENNGLSEEQLYELIFAKDRTVSHQTFWSEITYAVPQRPVNSVYHYVKRAYHPLKQQGRWSEEEDARLKQAVTDLGQSWERVSERVGRMPGDCRDRYRNHVALPDKNTGPWTPAEEEELTRIVKRLTIDRGKPADQDVFWGLVSREMGGKRSRQQCRIKWTDSLSKTVKNADKDVRWGQEDAFILVHKVDALDVRDDTEIDWRSLLDPGWNIWSPHTLQRRWTTLKRGIKGWEDMSHAEIMDILRVKKGMAPMPASSRRRAKKRTSTGDAQEGSSRVVSKEFIDDSDDESGDE
ncbi:uncharacterized protein SCHCODRAFT_071743 [Schizophyllum commune H4-8]|uniref:Uncharacterized protein n=1 Tax=Schizophyllum commune (strain H4-8 / FGSC 9210) TaxID=578458 RepID=D8PPD5_SCHCM|nr:uncharacterized protein SCHCODRAFT_071743 [Schizophyllum commune H4-8]KAI5893379.1 hypothetical protein SCHCODRAFT_071743 [Schizophyllum commune H4-8]